jgi:phthiodiolone/phenolphthiodiolone dimycocerosates ketoreductase
MSRLRVGLVSDTLNARHSPTALVRANYLAAAASRIDSLWVSDHLNAVLPRAIATPQYLGAAKLIPKITPPSGRGRRRGTLLPGTGWRGRDLAWV